MNICKGTVFEGVIAVLVSVVAPTIALATTYDAGDELKAHELSANDTTLPNGTWTYGTAPSSGLEVIPAVPDVANFLQYDVAQHTNGWLGIPSLQGWSHLDSALTSILVVNTSDAPVSPCCGFTIEPGTIFQHPWYSESEWSVVRWIAPSDGIANIAAEWVQKGSEAAQHELYVNGVQVPGASGYGTASYNASGIAVTTGDTIDFALGPSASLFFGSTSTQFDATVELLPVPEPATQVLGLISLIGVVCSRAQRTSNKALFRIGQ